jgi:hypothetical protein
MLIAPPAVLGVDLIVLGRVCRVRVRADADLPWQCPARREVAEQGRSHPRARRQMYRPGRLNFMPTV